VGIAVDAGELDSTACDRLAAGRVTDSGHGVSELPGAVVSTRRGFGRGDWRRHPRK
jgi:hypothetical protein